MFFILYIHFSNLFVHSSLFGLLHFNNEMAVVGCGAPYISQ